MIKLKKIGLLLLLTINILADDSTKIDLTSYDRNMDKLGYKLTIDKNTLMIKKADIEIAILAEEKKIYPIVQRIDKINKELKGLTTLCIDYYNDRKKISKDMFNTLSEKYPNLKSKTLNSYTQINEEELEKCKITQNQNLDRLNQEKQELFEKQNILNIKRSKLQIKLNSINKKLARSEKKIIPIIINKTTQSKREDKKNKYRPKICLRNKLDMYNVDIPHEKIATVDEVIDIFDLGERRILKIIDFKTGKNLEIETILIESVTHRDVHTKGYISANPKLQRPCP